MRKCWGKIEFLCIYNLSNKKKFGLWLQSSKNQKNLNDTQILKRILFGNSILESGLSEELFVFSDESRFSLHNDNGHIWYKRSDCDDAIFQNKDKYQKTIMVFGAIGYHFKSKLVLCNKNVNKIYYREIF